MRKSPAIQLISMLLLLMMGFPIKSQDYADIDERARGVSIRGTTSVSKLARELARNCQNDTEKARSFFIWIADNIAYDLRSFSPQSRLSAEQRLALQTPEQVIKRRQAVCEGYTNLFNALCESVGIQSIAVSGQVKYNDGHIAENGHLWSLILVDGKWGIVDPTWGAGGVDENKWKFIKQLDDSVFLPNPETIIKDHYPNDPLFQCLPVPITLQEFKSDEASLELYINRKTGNTTSSGLSETHQNLLASAKVDSTQYYLEAGNRSLALNPGNNFGLWASGKYHIKNAIQAREAHYQSIRDLKYVNYYPSEAWFDKQMPILKAWEEGALNCLKFIEKSSSREGNYKVQIENLKKSAQSNLKASRKALNDFPKLKADVKRGVRVRLYEG